MILSVDGDEKESEKKMTAPSLHRDYLHIQLNISLRRRNRPVAGVIDSGDS